MSYAYLLDDEYLRIQDFVGVLSESLPRLVPSKLNNTEMLVKSLVDQTKAYGRKIISLFESVDSMYKQSTAQSASDAGNSTISKKIKDYEDTIRSLTTQNEDFSSQIKQLRESVNNRPVFPNIKTSEFSVSDFKSPKDSQNKILSPISGAKTSSTLHSSGKRDQPNTERVYAELEESFLNADYGRAIQLLSQLEYKRPSSVTLDKFNSWLVISNRIKDSQIIDIYNKLGNLVSPAGRDNTTDSNVTFEKVVSLLEAEIPKMLAKNEYDYDPNTSNRRDSRGDNQFNKDQLSMKVDYLNNQLLEAQKQIGDRDVEMRVLRERLREKDTNMVQQCNFPNREHDGLLKSVEKEVRLRVEMEQKLQHSILEIRELQERNEGFEREIQIKQRLLSEAQTVKTRQNEVVSKLSKENAKLKEQNEFSENLEDIEKYKELLLDKEALIRALTEQLNEVQSSLHRSPEREPPRSVERGGSELFRRQVNELSPEHFQNIINQQNVSPSASHMHRSASKSNLAVENALHSQAAAINAINYTLSQISHLLQSQSQEKLASPHKHTQSSSSLIGNEENVPYSGPNEVQRILRANYNNLQQLQTDASNLRTQIESLVSTKKLDEHEITSLNSNLIEKITYAEDSFLNNISTCFQTLSQLTTLLQNLPQDSTPTVFLPQTLGLVQTVHGNLNKALEDFPDFSVEKASQKPAVEEVSILGSPGRTRNAFKDRLLRDQGDLTKKLRQSMLTFEKQQISDVFGKLTFEIDRSQELQQKLDSRDHLIHRLSLLLSEGLDRTIQPLSQLVKLADSTEAQALLNYATNELAQVKSKFGDLTSGSVKESSKHVLDLKKDFEEQKRSWTDNLNNIQTALESKSVTLIHEIEAERAAHDETTRRLKDVLSKYREQQDLELQIEVLQRDLIDRDTKLEYKQKELFQYEQILQEYEESRAEIQRLRNKHNEKSEEMNYKDLKIHQLKSELDTLKQDIGDLNKTRDEHRALSDFKTKAEATIRRNSESIDQIRARYIQEVEQLRHEIDTLNDNVERLQKDIQKKNSVISELTLNHDQIEESWQELREYLERRTLIALIKTLESEVEVQELRLRAEKYAENLKANREDLTSLKNDLQNAIQQQTDNQRDLHNLRRKNEDILSQNKILNDSVDRLREEKYELEEKIVKLNEVNQITKSDYRTVKEGLELKIQELGEKDREINHLHDIIRKDKSTDKEREIMSHFRQELNNKTRDINSLRNELQQSTQKNERLVRELDGAKTDHKFTPTQKRELDRLSTLNSGLAHDLDSIRKNLKHKDEMHHLEKDAYDREMQILQKKLTDLQNILDEKDQQLRNMPKSFFSPSESQNSRTSGVSGNSSFYANLIENKDMEIKRLTQIVKNLTENLKSTQENKYRLKKY